MSIPKPRSTAVTVLALACIAGCGAENVPSMLQPAGTGAERIASLWWLMLGLSIGVFLLVVLLLGYALFHQGNQRDEVPSRTSMALIFGGGAALPLLVIPALFVLTLITMSALAPTEDAEALTVQVTGHQFWWEVEYPDHGVVTANEIRIPAGEPVRLEVTSADVIHSFWVPELQGKIDMIPGRTNVTFIDAAEPGAYRGLCAEFCGVQHALMQLHVIAEPRDEFADWLKRQSAPATEADSALARRGEAIFMATGCAACHSIQGTGADADTGPDLTHLISRTSLAAGVLPTTRDNVREWIRNPQGVKPGNLMPAMEFDEDEWDALVEYLTGLD
ncbi:MAG: cytochrome c oxidase subunit II [Dehalococcoidia bacterium]